MLVKKSVIFDGVLEVLAPIDSHILLDVPPLKRLAGPARHTTENNTTQSSPSSQTECLIRTTLNVVFS